MLASQYTDRKEVNAPEQQCDTSAVSVVAVSHMGEQTGHWHEEAAEEENTVDDHQPFQPQIRFILCLNRETDEEGGKCHDAIAQQIIIEQQATILVIQYFCSLAIQFFQADCGCLRIIDQQDQHGIDSRQDEPDICRNFCLFSTLMLESGGHHDISDRQKHTDQIGTEMKAADDTYREKKHRDCHNDCPGF